jgi:hypothetical protein
MPLLAPVITAVRPARLGRSFAVQLVLGMRTNVGGDNNDVNANIV